MRTIMSALPTTAAACAKFIKFSPVQLLGRSPHSPCLVQHICAARTVSSYRIALARLYGTRPEHSSVPTGKQIIEIVEEQQQHASGQVAETTRTIPKSPAKPEPEFDIDAEVEKAEKADARRAFWKLGKWQKVAAAVVLTVCVDVGQNVYYRVWGPPALIVTDEEVEWYKQRLGLRDDLQVREGMSPVQQRYSRMLRKATEDGDSSDFVYHSLRWIIDLSAFGVSAALLLAFF